MEDELLTLFRLQYGHLPSNELPTGARIRWLLERDMVNPGIVWSRQPIWLWIQRRLGREFSSGTELVRCLTEQLVMEYVMSREQLTRLKLQNPWPSSQSDVHERSEWLYQQGIVFPGEAAWRSHPFAQWIHARRTLRQDYEFPLLYRNFVQSLEAEEVYDYLAETHATT